MTTEYVNRLQFFLAGIIRLGASLIVLVALVLFAQMMGSTIFSDVYDYVTVDQPTPTTHSSSIVLTLIFVITFAYSLFGALISGASDKTTQSICFSCLFSTSLGLSIVGFGLSWNDPVSYAIWCMLATISVLTCTSYFARKKSTWQQHS